MSKQAFIHTSGLTKFFGKTCALDHVDWCLPAGTVVGLLLPSDGSCCTLGVEAIPGFRPRF